MNLLHLIVRQWRQRPARTVLSIFSVAIAVAAVFGVVLAQASVRQGYRKVWEAVEGRPALEIVAAGGGRFETTMMPDVSRVNGIFADVPVVTRATLVRVKGKRIRSVVLGVPADREKVWEALPIVAGRACEDADEAVLAADLAKTLKIEPGARLTLLSRRGPRSATVVGLVNAQSLREFAPAAVLVMPLGAVQQFFGLGDQIDRVRVLLDSSDQREAVKAAVAERLPKELVVQAPVNQLELADDILRSSELALRFAGALTMAMAAFVILNTLRMNFGERRRDIAVLRVLGATSRQLVHLHLAEGFCLGLIGSVLGIPLGMALGRGLSVAMQAMVGADVPVPPAPYWMFPLALVAGPLVACVAALLPALQSRGVSPNEALGDSESRRADRLPVWTTAVGLVTWLVAVGMLVLVMLERLSPEAAIPAGVLMIVGFITVIPVLLGPLVRGAAALVSPVSPMEGGFAAEQLLQRPTRTGLTVGVLVVAISTSLGMGNAIVNNVDDVRAWYRRTMSTDIFVMGPSPTAGALEAGDRNRIGQLISKEPGVEHVTEVRYYSTRANGLPAACVVRNFSPEGELPWTVSAEEGQQILARLQAGEAVVGAVLAKRLGLHPGDTLRLELQGRLVSLKVAQSVRDYTLGGLVLFIDQPTAEKLIELGSAELYLVRPKPGVEVAALAGSLEKLLSDEGLTVETFSEMRREFDQLINGVVAALWGLMGIGFVIGGVAVGNTLTMSVLEQTRELGLLRIIGMTRGQVRKLIFCESLLLGLIGGLLGTVAGFLTAWIIHLCNEPLLGQAVPFAFHPWLLAATAGLCMLVAVLAAWSPGRRAARLDLLAAIAYE